MSAVTGPTNQRQFLSVHLHHPIPGHVGSTLVYITRVSLTHLTAVHESELTTNPATVVFEWNGEVVQMTGRVLRSTKAREKARELFASEIELSHIEDDSLTAMRKLIGQQVERALDEQMSNAQGVPAVNAVAYQTGAASQGYVRCTLQPDNTWLKVETRDAEQPVLGFTISRGESDEEIDMLCAVFQRSDEGGRKMIRQLAEISVSQRLGVPTRKYNP